MLDLISDEGDPAPAAPATVERPSGDAEEAFDNYKGMVNAKLRKGEKVPPPPGDSDGLDGLVQPTDE